MLLRVPRGCKKTWMHDYCILCARLAHTMSAATSVAVLVLARLDLVRVLSCIEVFGPGLLSTTCPATVIDWICKRLLHLLCVQTQGQECPAPECQDNRKNYSAFNVSDLRTGPGRLSGSIKVMAFLSKFDLYILLCQCLARSCFGEFLPQLG